MKKTSQLNMESDAARKLHIAAVEFINDWRKGDFDLPVLAQHDAQALANACDKYLESLNVPTKGERLEEEG